jgi:hypothetical protein
MASSILKIRPSHRYDFLKEGTPDVKWDLPEFAACGVEY